MTNFSTNILNKFSFKNPLLFEWVFLLYVICGSIISHIFPIPELIKSVLALPSWLIIPYFFGSFFRLALARLRIVCFKGIDAGIFSLIFGIYSLIIFTFLLDLLGFSLLLSYLYLIVLGLGIAYLAIKTIGKSDDDLQINGEKLRAYLPILTFCILVSIIPALMKTSVPGFPYGTIETISIPFEQTQPAIRFMEHGYLQHPRIYDYVSLGMNSRLFNIEPLSFIWASPFLMMAIFSTGLYLFTYSISKNKPFSLIAVFIGSFLNMNIFRDAPLLFKANVFLYIFLPFILYLSHKIISKKNYTTKTVIFSLSILGLLSILYVYLFESNIWSIFVPSNLAYPLEWRSHVWIPSITVLTVPLILLITLFSKKFVKNLFLDDVFFLIFIPFFFFSFQNSEAIAFNFFIFGFILLFFINRTRFRPMLYLFVVSVFVFVLYQIFVTELAISNPISSILLPSYSSSAEIIPFSSRLNWIFEINLSIILVIILIFGIVVSLLSKRQKNLFIISVFSFALLLYLFPESFAYRFYRELTIITAFVLAIGIWRIFVALSDLKRKSSAFLFSLLLIVLLLPSLITPVYERYSQTSMGQSLVSESEYFASQWLKENTAENSIIVSDFETIQLLGTLANKILPVNRNYLLENLNDESTQTLWRIKHMFVSNYQSYSLDPEFNPQFWKAYSFGKGSIDIETTNITLSENNKAIRITDGNKSVAGLIHRFPEIQDWNNITGIYINWLGKNTNSTWQICIAAPDDSNWFAYSFVDNFEGWANVTASFSSFIKVGSPTWSTISYVAIRTSNAVPNTWIFKDVGLRYIDSISIDPEEIAYIRNQITSTEQRFCQQVGLSLENPPVLIVLSSRTIQWLKQEGIEQSISKLKEPTDITYIDLIRKTHTLNEIYSLNNQIYIFKVTD